MTTVRRLEEDDWALLSEVRLRALEESPGVFASSSARELGFKESHWRMRLRGSSWWVAQTDGGTVGLVCSMQEPGAPEDERHVVSFWVDPAHRRRGVGSALLAAVEQDARESGAVAVTLWQVESNDDAAALYRGRGYAPTGATMALPRDPSQTEHRWRLAL